MTTFLIILCAVMMACLLYAARLNWRLTDALQSAQSENAALRDWIAASRVTHGYGHNRSSIVVTNRKGKNDETSL